MCTNEKNDKNKIGLISKKTFILLSTERRGKSESNNQEKSSYMCTRKSTRKKTRNISNYTWEMCKVTYLCKRGYITLRVRWFVTKCAKMRVVDQSERWNETRACVRAQFFTLLSDTRRHLSQIHYKLNYTFTYDYLPPFITAELRELRMSKNRLLRLRIAADWMCTIDVANIDVLLFLLYNVNMNLIQNWSRSPTTFRQKTNRRTIDRL